MKPCPSQYNSAIFKKLASSWSGLGFFAYGRDTARKKNIFAVWQASLKLGESCGVWEWRRPPPSISEHSTSYNQGKVGAFPPLAGMQQGRRTSWLHEKFSQICVEPVAFLNGLWLAHRHLPRKGTVLKFTTVQFVNGHKPRNKWTVRQQFNLAILYRLSHSCPVHQQA